MVRWTFINAIGGVCISTVTLGVASFLLVSLWVQGRGKLRVRLLLGMVISDILLGLVAIVPESIYLANGVGLETGTAGCDAQAFLLTTILWTQHLWTLAIATATYGLLKHPMSRFTTQIEAYSWVAPPVIWALSLAHSGIWWKYVGWTNLGNLCYYAPHPMNDHNGLDARDLIQFIPRAFVFIYVLCLYSTLFSFLRRPDTIQVSSQFGTGGQSDPNKEDTTIAQDVGRFLRKRRQKKEKPVDDPEAPWEKMEFVQIGHGRNFGLSPVLEPSPMFPAPLPIESQPVKSVEEPIRPIPSSKPTPITFGKPIFNPKYLDTPPVSIHKYTKDDSRRVSSTSRPSETETLIGGEGKEVSKPSPVVFAKPLPVIVPARSISSKEASPSLSTDEPEPAIADGTRRASGQSLKDFFQANQAPDLRDANGVSTKASKKQNDSATAYFNRQASLLMLYFPIAYLVVFSVSLVRLIYGMVHKKPSPALALMSSWMILSVGLIDGLVYGLAEFLVKRKVRRKMPDRMGG